MSPPEARRLAMIKLGGIEPSKEIHRDSRGLPWLDGILHDVRYAARSLRRSPGFTVVAVATLAIGIGVNATIVMVANALLFKGPPLIYRNDRLVYLSMRGSCCVSWPDLEDWRAQSKSFDGMAGINGVWLSFADPRGLLEKAGGIQVSTNLFHLLGQQPLIGRNFVPSDAAPGAPPVAILTYRFWESRYAKDPAILGQTVRINGTPTTLIGVMPRGFSYPWMQDLWVPLTPTTDLRQRDNRDAVWFVVGRLADGSSIESARAEMEAIGRRLATIYPLTNRGAHPEVLTFRDYIMGPNAITIYSSMCGAVGFVLLIACANLANLRLARAIGRSREISIRIALGAGRWRIIRQLLIESLMLSTLGGVAGWWIAQAGVRAYALLTIPEWKQSWFDFTMDYRVLGYLVGITLVAGLLSGLAPALSLSRLNFHAKLKEGGRSANGGGRGKRLSAILVTAELALAIVLLAGAGVMIRSFLKIYTAEVGVKADNVLDAYLSLPEARYSAPQMQLSFYDRLKTRLRALPGVESVAIANFLPTRGSSSFPYELAGSRDPGTAAGEPPRPTLSAIVVGPDYFATLGATVLAGREFNDADGGPGVFSVIVNQRFATTHWQGANALGKHLRLLKGRTYGPWLTVVGVVSDIVQNDRTRQETEPLIYLPYRQEPAPDMYVVLRTLVPPASLTLPFWREIQAVEPNLPVGGPSPLKEFIGSSYQDSGINGALFGIFAAIALLLASIGLYAVAAHSVSLRTQEIGIRMAIGATAHDIRRLVLLQGMLPLGIGLPVGLAASFAVNRLLRSQLVHVSPSDPITLVAASTVLILAATLGCLIPARRAMRVDPVIALRHD